MPRIAIAKSYDINHKLPTLSSKVAVLFCIFTSNEMRVCLALYPCWFCLFVFSHVTGVWWYIVLICDYVMAGSVEYLIPCSFAV